MTDTQQPTTTDPQDTARATLAAVAEVVGMMNQGGE